MEQTKGKATKDTSAAGAMTGYKDGSEEYSFVMDAGIGRVQFRAYFRVWNDKILVDFDNFNGVKKPPDSVSWVFNHKSFVDLCSTLANAPKSFSLCHQKE